MLALWLVCRAAVAAPVEPAPTERVALVLVRSMSYDRSVARGTGELRVAVVYAAASPIGEEVIHVVGGLQGVTVSGRSIGAPVGVPVTGTTDFASKLVGFDAVLLCGGIDADLPRIVTAAHTLGVVLLSLEPSYVGRGAALGVDIDGTRLQLRIDRTEAREQGAEFTAELIELAVPVRQ